MEGVDRRPHDVTRKAYGIAHPQATKCMKGPESTGRQAVVQGLEASSFCTVKPGGRDLSQVKQRTPLDSTHFAQLPSLCM